MQEGYKQIPVQLYNMSTTKYVDDMPELVVCLPACARLQNDILFT